MSPTRRRSCAATGCRSRAFPTRLSATISSRSSCRPRESLSSVALRAATFASRSSRDASSKNSSHCGSAFTFLEGFDKTAAFSLDPRAIGAITARKEGAVPPVHALAVTSDGYSLRFGFEPFVEVSTRSGRRFARPSDGVEVVGVTRITGEEIVIAATREARAMLCRADEVNYLSGPGKGVILIKLADEDHVLGFIASVGDRDLMRVETSRGSEQTISTTKSK